VHFYTHTTIDTLDYSGTGLNSGSKVVFAAYGEVIRELCKEVPDACKNVAPINALHWVMPGVLSVQTQPFTNYENAVVEMAALNQQLQSILQALSTTVMIIVGDDAAFIAASVKNYLWVTYTRCNPSHDMYGVDDFQENKHWGCNGPLLIDARIKPHHAPPVEKDSFTEHKIQSFIEKYFHKKD
jgi:4-hydroxy-3-polyprenylbenzoate decarboxylase